VALLDSSPSDPTERSTVERAEVVLAFSRRNLARRTHDDARARGEATA